MYDMIIVGAGPAGMTAAVYARRASKKVLVLESKSYGGQIINTLDIENYPAEEHISGFDFATKLYNQAKNLGAEFNFEKVLEVKNYDSYKEIITTKNQYKCKAVILASGSKNRLLGLPHEEDFIGKGISYCATCDGNFYKNKVVAVVGGGNTALDSALYLSNIAKLVYIIHRRDQFTGNRVTLDKLKSKDNVKFILNSTVIKLNPLNSKLAKKLKNIEISDKEKNSTVLNLDGLFVAIGRVPENESFVKFLNLNSQGYINSDETCKTEIGGIFAAGDIRAKSLRQLVTAVSDGAVAATEAVNFINAISNWMKNSCIYCFFVI